MAIWTYVKNTDPKNKNAVILLRNGTLQLHIGTYADLTEQEVEYIFDSSSGFVLEEGIKSPSSPASGETSVSNPTTILKWKSKTYYLENQLVVNEEGELLRTLRNFETKETYEF